MKCLRSVSSDFALCMHTCTRYNGRCHASCGTGTSRSLNSLAAAAGRSRVTFSAALLQGGCAAPKLHALRVGLSQPTIVKERHQEHRTAFCSRQADSLSLHAVSQQPCQRAAALLSSCMRFNWVCHSPLQQTNKS